MAKNFVRRLSSGLGLKGDDHEAQSPDTEDREFELQSVEHYDGAGPTSAMPAESPQWSKKPRSGFPFPLSEEAQEALSRAPRAESLNSASSVVERPSNELERDLEDAMAHSLLSPASSLASLRNSSRERASLTSLEERKARYELSKVAGAKHRLWMEDAAEADCRVSRSSLTLINIEEDYNFEVATISQDPERFAYGGQIIKLGLPRLQQRWQLENTGYRSLMESAYCSVAIRNRNAAFIGHTGPGVIFCDYIQRYSETKAEPEHGVVPYISEMALAAYREEFDLQDLKYIFFTDVVNDETLMYIKNVTWPQIGIVSDEELEGSDDDGLPLFEDDYTQTFEPDTPEYNALLGSPIGKVAANIVLGGYERGTRTISKITTWPGIGGKDSCHIRFDVSAVNP